MSLRAVMMRRIFRATANAVPAARHAVVAFAEQQGIRGSALHDIALAVSEACTNVVLHAYRGRDQSGTFEVTARRPGNELEIAVSDGGVGMLPHPESPGMGVGLPLIAELTRSVEVHADDEQGTTIVMRFLIADDARDPE
jgi:anti-sigma regulatory factor (Ser/Thr protein kinase)